jgi:hypothetical protein
VLVRDSYRYVLLREDFMRALGDLPEAMEAIRAHALQLQGGKKRCVHGYMRVCIYT